MANDNQQKIDTIATLTGTLSVLYSIGKEEETKIVLAKIIEIVNKL